MSKVQPKSARAEKFAFYFSLFTLVFVVCISVFILLNEQKQKAIYSEIDKLNKETALLMEKTKKLQALALSARSN